MTNADGPVWLRGVGGRMDGGSLRQVPGFEMFSDDALVRLAEHTRWNIFKEGDRVAGLDEEGPNLLLVAQGKARVLVCPMDRLPVELFSLIAGDAVAPDDLAELMREDTYLEAQSGATVILRMPAVLYEREVFANEAALLARQQVRRQTQDITRLLWEELYGDALTRLRHELYREWEQNPGHEIGLTHTELAIRIGVHREDVTKMLAKLSHWKIIDFEPHRHGIRVLEPEKLAPTHRREEL